MGCADAFRRRWTPACGQRHYRKPDPAGCYRALELAFRRIAAGRPVSRCGDEPDSVGTHKWPRPLRLSEGRGHATANAACQSGRRTAATSLATGPQNLHLIADHDRLPAVNMRSPRAYVRRLAARGQEGSRRLEHSALGQTEWARAACLSERRDGAPANASVAPDRRGPAPSLAAASVISSTSDPGQRKLAGFSLKLMDPVPPRGRLSIQTFKTWCKRKTCFVQFICLQPRG